MKKIKYVLSMLLACVMLLGSVTNAFARDIPLEGDWMYYEKATKSTAKEPHVLSSKAKKSETVFQDSGTSKADLVKMVSKTYGDFYYYKDYSWMDYIVYHKGSIYAEYKRVTTTKPYWSVYFKSKDSVSKGTKKIPLAKKATRSYSTSKTLTFKPNTKWVSQNGFKMLIKYEKVGKYTYTYKKGSRVCTRNATYTTHSYPIDIKK